MNVEGTTKTRGAHSGDDQAPKRVSEKHEPENRSSVAELAYRLYEERGRQDGHHLEDWLEAERPIAATMDQEGPPSPTTTPPAASPRSSTTGTGQPVGRPVVQSAGR